MTRLNMYWIFKYFLTEPNILRTLKTYLSLLLDRENSMRHSSRRQHYGDICDQTLFYVWVEKKFLPCCASVCLLLYLLHTKLPIFGQNWKSKQDRRQILNQEKKILGGCDWPLIVGEAMKLWSKRNIRIGKIKYKFRTRITENI